MLHVFEEVIVRRDIKRALPELRGVHADEGVDEGSAGEDRAERQHIKRDHHHIRQFMRIDVCSPSWP